ncbi:sperm flagellar protein 1 [Tribolium castaneum]|uniref:Sperm flagellar protein 1-like Protein n=1 Tax=Tribolium castaneum TaxID=7070 RepID=D6X1I2_TRICA|nr:PREDICTED: sperm flagellar protein 1 [Tribolium castaneum]EFA09498.1 Sperm flagellar protein 1-like Protein [Tribolium castaneum]|eukprot:XP_969808.1 PREDICTED: sperm flagellar protein 1 [Tribolium castaneum]
MDAEYEELYKWIEEHTITRPKRNINRDFSDAIPLIEILKVHYPKLVEVHNYSPKNSFAQKIINWETLNNKVLKRLKLNLTKKRIDQLAKAEPGAIEKLLLEVKKKVETKDSSNDNYEILYLEGSPSAASRNGTKKVITHAAFEKLQADLVEKSEAVTILKNKVDHLENLLNIKEERIKDLSLQLQTIVNQSSRPESGQGSKFFGFFQSASLIPDPIKNE